MSEAHQFDPAVVSRQLAELSTRHVAAFAAACCELLLPNYEKFVVTPGWGDMAILRRAIG